MTAQTWFKHAVFYEIDTRSFQDSNGDGVGDLKGITERLEYIRSLGVDAILLAPLTSASVGCSTTVVIGERVWKVHCVSSGTPPNIATAEATPSINPAFGSLDDLDDLILAASRLGIRVLLDLPTPDPGLARFWLTRGLAGFHVPPQTPDGQSNASAIQAIRKLLPSFVGQRVLITDTPADSAPGGVKSSANELLLDTDLLKLPVTGAAAGSNSAAADTLAAQIRAALDHSQSLLRAGTPLLATDAPGLPRAVNRLVPADDTPHHEAEISRTLATILLLSWTSPLLEAGQELALASASGGSVPMPWGAPPPAPSSTEPAAISEPAPAKPAPAPATDRYVPYVAPKPVIKAIAAPPPDPASVAGQELDPKSPLSLYRQLNQLRHGGTALRDGDETFLNFDALNALVWVRKPASPSFANPPIVVLCNLSDKPVAINLKPELMRLHLRGSFLKTVLRSDGGMGAMDLSPVRIPPYGVYVGELKF